MIDETRNSLTPEEMDRANEEFAEKGIDDIDLTIRRVRADEALPPHDIEDDGIFAPFVEPLPEDLIEDEEVYEDLEYDEEFFEEDETRKGPR